MLENYIYPIINFKHLYPYIKDVYIDMLHKYNFITRNILFTTHSYLENEVLENH
jgi:hypothetical protein